MCQFDWIDSVLRFGVQVVPRCLVLLGQPVIELAEFVHKLFALLVAAKGDLFYFVQTDLKSVNP
jgi:hypothetical protein